GNDLRGGAAELWRPVFRPGLGCPFGEYLSDGEGLPVLVVDEEIYRLVPSLIIATVDKFARLTLRTQQPLPGPGTVGGHHLPGSARRAGVLPMTPAPAGTDRARERCSCGMAMTAGRIDPAIARCWARVLGRGGPRKHCWKLRPPRASITMPCPWPGPCVNVPTRPVRPWSWPCSRRPPWTSKLNNADRAWWRPAPTGFRPDTRALRAPPAPPWKRCSGRLGVVCWW